MLASYPITTILPSVKPPYNKMNSGLYIAFDGDAILFSDEAERVFINKKEFLHLRLIKKAVNYPISEDPFKGFLKALQQLQSQFPVNQCPIRTALVTARHPPRARRGVFVLMNLDSLVV